MGKPGMRQLDKLELKLSWVVQHMLYVVRAIAWSAHTMLPTSLLEDAKSTQIMRHHQWHISCKLRNSLKIGFGNLAIPEVGDVLERLLRAKVPDTPVQHAHLVL